MANAKVDWYAADVVLLAQDASDEIIKQAAFYVEGTAKTDAPVDTGFMRNAIYTITDEGTFFGGGSGTGWPAGDYTDKAGQTSFHDRAGTVAVKEHEAAVHAAAEYTIYQETRSGFLYHALEAAQAITPGIIEAVGRERFQ